MSQDLSRGLAEAFRSDQTPPFAQMLGQLFGNSNGDIKARVLNSLIAAAGPGMLSNILQKHGNPVAPQGEVTAEQADGIPAAAVEEMAQQAESKNPGIVDQISDFYAEHPTLVQTLGALAVGMAMKHMSGQKRGMF
ncbi:MAG: hypothetical protein H7039_19435 [Bryobacteraceae bacterium]|nr:hypothetical protein [Bryobacteraceae bacterium]